MGYGTRSNEWENKGVLIITCYEGTTRALSRILCRMSGKDRFNEKGKSLSKRYG